MKGVAIKDKEVTDVLIITSDNFPQYYREHIQMVYRIALGIVRIPEEAEDIVKSFTIGKQKLKKEKKQKIQSEEDAIAKEKERERDKKKEKEQSTHEIFDI